MKGTLTLFQDVFVEADEQPERLRKGRSEHLINRRNECLVDRYFYLSKVTEKRYDVILKIISEEFFLSKVTIPEIIDANSTQLHLLKKEQPKKKFFSNKWPHLVW